MFRFLLNYGYICAWVISLFKEYQPQILEDFKGFIKRALNEKRKVEWLANKNNSIVNRYQDIAYFFNGSWRPEVGSPEILHFFVPREDLIQDELETESSGEDINPENSIVEASSKVTLSGSSFRCLAGEKQSIKNNAE